MGSIYLKVVVQLKPEQRTSHNTWMMTFDGQPKEVTQQSVQFVVTLGMQGVRGAIKEAEEKVDFNELTSFAAGW